MADLKVAIAGAESQNSLITASDTSGSGHEYLKFFPLSTLDSTSCKGIMLRKRMDDLPSCIAGIPGGIPNVIGLQDPGAGTFMKEDLPWFPQQGTRIIANITSNIPAEYCEMAERLSDAVVDMVELNISCPNVKQGGVYFGTFCAGVEGIITQVRRFCRKPLTVELSPNVADIGDITGTVESTGADAISLINTLTGMHISIKACRPILHNNTGGPSGPVMPPIAVCMVWQAIVGVNIPVVGMGDISTWQDTVRTLLADASALQIGTMFFSDPRAPLCILRGLNKYIEQNGAPSVTELADDITLW